MPLDTSLLSQPLQAGTATALDPLDPRFSDIATLAEGGEFAKAAAQSEAMMREGMYDVRLVGYYLYGLFAEGGLAALDGALAAASGLLGESFAAFGPEKKKEQHAQAALAWFFGRLSKKLLFEEEKKGPDWQKWIATVGSEPAQALSDKLAAVRKAVAMTLGDASKVTDPLQKVDEWLKSYQRIVYAPPPPEPSAEPEAEPDAAKAAGRVAAPGGDGAGTLPVVEGSIHLVLLIRKLEAFAALMQKEDHPRAAMVALDVLGIIEKFDPRLYFPKLFTPFYAALAPNVEKLQSFWEAKETMPWQLMEQLYKIDLEAFMTPTEELTPAPE